MSSSPDPDEESEAPQGTITPTGPGPLVVAGVLGLVLGWAVRPISLQLGSAEPYVPLLTIGLLLFAAAIIGMTGVRHAAYGPAQPLRPRSPPGRQPAGARQGMRTRRSLPRRRLPRLRARPARSG